MIVLTSIGEDKESEKNNYYFCCLINSVLMWILIFFYGWCYYYCNYIATINKECVYYSSTTGECNRYEKLGPSICIGDSNYTSIFALLFAIVYILYLIESLWKSKIREYLKQVIDSRIIENRVNYEWKTCKPQIQWILRCYHLVTTVHVNGSTSTTREYTATCVKYFEYGTISDDSGIFDLDEEKTRNKALIQLKFSKQFCFANGETERIYNKQLGDFILSSKSDIFQDFEFSFDIEGYGENIICKDVKACCFDSFWFIVCVLLGFSWIYRVIIDCKSAKKSFKIMKRIAY